MDVKWFNVNKEVKKTQRRNKFKSIRRKKKMSEKKTEKKEDSPKLCHVRRGQKLWLVLLYLFS